MSSNTYGRNQGGGRQGVRTPLKNRKNMRILSNTGPDPLKIAMLPSQHSSLGHHRPASETPEWRFAGGPMMAHLERYFDPFSPHQLKNVKFGPPLTKLSGSAHDTNATGTQTSEDTHRSKMQMAPKLERIDTNSYITKPDTHTHARAHTRMHAHTISATTNKDLPRITALERTAAAGTDAGSIHIH